MVPPDSFPARYCRFVSRHAGTILAVASVLFVVAALLASRLELRTSFSELLPSDDPGVVALTKTQERMGDMSLLLIGVRSPDRDANLRYAELVTRKLQALPKNVVEFAACNVRDLRSFFKENKWLYASEDDLIEIRDRLRREITKRKNPLLVDLDDDETVEQMKDRLTKRDWLNDRFPDGVFSNKDGSYVWVAALPPGGVFGERAGEAIFQAANQIIQDNDPRSFHPEMLAHVGGPVATLIATRAAVERDILWVTVTCLLIVAASLWVFFRRFRAVPLVGVSAVIGSVMAFAMAELLFGYVNSSTAFLGSIILGNGINYGIILISRYQELRAEGLPAPQALEQALAGVMRGTGVAAVCASADYATLMLTSFRGFYQFGVMAAFGQLFCWLLTFTVLPALFLVIDRRASAERASDRPPINFAFLRPLLAQNPGGVTLVAAVLTVVCGYGVLHFVDAPFEYDFRKLNAKLDSTEDDKAFNRSMESLFGRWPSPTIVLADSRAETESIRQAIKKQDRATGDKQVIGQIVTVYDLLPGTPEVQTRKLDLLAKIRKLAHDPALDVLTADERKQIDAVDPPTRLHLLTPEELPALARRPFTEADGTVGRVVLVYPVEENLSVWNGRDLLRIARVLQVLHLDDEHKTIDTSGSAVVFAAMIRSVLHDGPRATAAALLAVLLLVLLIMRPLSSAGAAIATLLLGVIWMLGVAGLFAVRITFLNFIALPITFGIGAEYGLNVAVRYRQDRDMIRAVISTGAAVAVCSWTTIVGYGSLLAARNRALQGFGAMAILGELACISAAILALPATLLWIGRRRHPHGNPDRVPNPSRDGAPPAKPAGSPRD
jgi:predicted RND superfamily exporter protein